MKSYTVKSVNGEIADKTGAVIIEVGAGTGSTLQEVTDAGNQTDDTVIVEGVQFNDLNNEVDYTYSYIGSGVSTGNCRAFALGKDGFIYIANSNTGTVDKLSKDGTVVQYGSTITDIPSAIALDSKGNVFTSNSSGTISKIDTNEVTTLVFATVGNSPDNMIIDEDDNLYITNYDDYTISKVTPLGVSTVFAVNVGVRPGKLIMDSLNNIYVICGDETLQKVDTLGVVTELYSPTNDSTIDLAIDSLGNIYMTSSNDQNILKVDPTGTTGTIIYTHNTLVLGIAISSDDSIFATSFDGSVFKLDAVTYSYTLLGSNGGGAFKIEIAGNGDVYSNAITGAQIGIHAALSPSINLLTLDAVGNIIKELNIEVSAKGVVSTPNAEVADIVNPKDLVTLEKLEELILPAGLSGTSSERELATSTPVGVSFWDTDLKIPCYLESGVWYNTAGGVVS